MCHDKVLYKSTYTLLYLLYYCASVSKRRELPSLHSKSQHLRQLMQLIQECLSGSYFIDLAGHRYNSISAAMLYCDAVDFILGVHSTQGMSVYVTSSVYILTLALKQSKTAIRVYVWIVDRNWCLLQC